MEEKLDLGPCCACGGTENVRNVMMLDRKGPTPGKGWGCFVCDLPLDGAVAVLCDDCLEAKAEIRFVCGGYPSQDGRVLIEDLPDGPFGHDLSVHFNVDGEHLWRLDD